MARWHEYRVSPAGELALAFTNTMVPLGFGLGAGLALTFAMGLPAEEGFLETFLLDLGVAPETVWDTVKAFDFLSRIGLALMFGVGIIAAFAGCFASSHADVATARGLVAATRAGAPRTDVPVPHQVERVVRKDSSALEGLLIMFSLVASILLIPLFFFAASDEFTGGMVVSGIGLAAVAGMVYWWRYLRNVQRPAQHRRRLEAAAHWTTEDEEAAWQAAREADVNTLESAGIPQNSQDPMRDYKRAKKRQRHQFVRFGKRLDRFGIGGLILAPAIFYLLTFLLYPDARQTSPSQWELGRRADLEGSTQQLATIGMAVLVALLLAAAILPSVGLLLQGLGERAERAELRLALDSPNAARPIRALLVYHTGQHGSAFGRFIAGTSGLLISFGPAVLILSTMSGGGFYSGAGEIFSPFRTTGVAATILGFALLLGGFALNASSHSKGMDFRNALLHRWPTLPDVKTTSEGDNTVQVESSVGPSLTPSYKR